MIIGVRFQENIIAIFLLQAFLSKNCYHYISYSAVNGCRQNESPNSW